MLRVILLLALSIFSTQAWSYVTSPIHHYDVNECYYIDQNIQSECQNHQYDGKQTSFKTVACLQADSIGKRTLNGTFFVFLDGFVAAKSITRTKKVEPITDASGPHTTWKADPQTGGITRHETWRPNPRNPSGWDTVQSTDLRGASHINKQTGEAIPTPHTQGKGIPGGVRPAKPREIPRENH